MIETIFLAFLIAKIKGYDVKRIFKSWPIYIIIGFETVFLFVQAMIFKGVYPDMKFLAISKIVYLSFYLTLILKYELYKSAIYSSIFTVIGGILNDIAIKANNGYMPVYPSISYLTGYVKPQAFQIANGIHILGNSDTKFKILTDFIDLGYCILSIGDVFIRIFVFSIIYNAIKTSNAIEIKEENDVKSIDF